MTFLDEIRICYRRMDGGCIVARSISRHFEMEPRQDSILFYLFFFFFLFFFPPPWSVPNHCYYERSPVRTRAFFSFVHPPSCIPPDASSSLYVPSILSSDRIRPGQLHFFPARGRNKTMISVSRPFPTCLASA